MLIRGTQAASVSAEGDRPRGGRGRRWKDRAEQKDWEDETYLQQRERRMLGSDEERVINWWKTDRRRQTRDKTKGREWRCWFWWVFDSPELQWESKGPSLRGEVLCYTAQGVIPPPPLINRQEQPLPRRTHIHRRIYTHVLMYTQVSESFWRLILKFGIEAARS